jgi:serine/threonine-protein kinase RsbW
MNGHFTAMRMSVRLDLPREVDSVPAVRKLLRCALAVLHVDRESGEDLELALTEACANVVDHADGADKFEVHLDVAHNRCSIDVVDDGTGFDADAMDGSTPAGGSERGRGLFLIRALSDNVRMYSSPREGSMIHFEKSFA